MYILQTVGVSFILWFVWSTVFRHLNAETTFVSYSMLAIYSIFRPFRKIVQRNLNAEMSFVSYVMLTFVSYFA